MKMSLILHSSLTSCGASATINNRHFLHLPHHTLSKSLLLHPIKSQKSSEPPISTQSTDDTSSTAGEESGSSSNRKKSKKGRKVIRRAPVETPKVVPKQEEKVEEQSLGENVFLLAWSVIGTVILVEGLLLAASGFLPEEWDQKIVKYLYPAFTPTVFLFLAGTVVYGVLKYLQNEKPQSSK